MSEEVKLSAIQRIELERNRRSKIAHDLSVPAEEALEEHMRVEGLNIALAILRAENTRKEGGESDA